MQVSTNTKLRLGIYSFAVRSHQKTPIHCSALLEPSPYIHVYLVTPKLSEHTASSPHPPISLPSS
jgi:hypothetical protein